MLNIIEKMHRKENEVRAILRKYGILDKEEQDSLMNDLFICLGVIKKWLTTLLHGKK